MDSHRTIPTVVIRETVQRCSQCTRGFLSTRECKLHEEQHFKPILIKNIYCTKEIEKPLKCEYEIVPKIKIEIDQDVDESNEQCEKWNETGVTCKYEDKTWTSKVKISTASSNSQRYKQNKKHDEKIKYSEKQKSNNKNQKDVRISKGADGYKCPYCPKKYTRHLKIVEHYKEHVKEMPHSCEVCSQGFLRKRDYNRHQTAMHDKVRRKKPENFKCSICARVFKMKLTLKHHIYTHTGEKPHKCKECGRAFTQRCGLNVHMNGHRNLKEYKCPTCHKGFNNISTLNVHKKIHVNNREYKCTYCPKAFNDGSAYRRHKRIHTGEMMYTCELCKKQFTDYSGYHAHKLRHDINNRKHKCDLCPDVFFTKCDLMSHRKSKHETEHACRLCTEKFTSIKALNIHLVGSHEVKYQCDICNYRTLKRRTLTDHIRKHYTRRKDKNGGTKTMLKQVNFYY